MDILTAIDVLWQHRHIDSYLSNPEVLFVCVHNAGRSQMAAALMTLRSKGEVQVRSAGTEPGEMTSEW